MCLEFLLMETLYRYLPQWREVPFKIIMATFKHDDNVKEHSRMSLTESERFPPTKNVHRHPSRYLKLPTISNYNQTADILLFLNVVHQHQRHRHFVDPGLRTKHRRNGCFHSVGILSITFLLLRAHATGNLFNRQAAAYRGPSFIKSWQNQNNFLYLTFASSFAVITTILGTLWLPLGKRRLKVVKIFVFEIWTTVRQPISSQNPLVLNSINHSFCNNRTLYCSTLFHKWWVQDDPAYNAIAIAHSTEPDDVGVLPFPLQSCWRWPPLSCCRPIKHGLTFTNNKGGKVAC